MSTTYEQAVLADQPLAYWRFNGAQTDRVGDRAMPSGGAGWDYTQALTGDQTPRHGILLQGDGHGIHDNIDGWLDWGSAFTLEMLVLTGITGIRSLLDRDPESSTRVFQFRLNGAELELILWTSAGGPIFCRGGVLPENVAAHVAATYDGQMMRCYIDGVEVAATAHTGATPAAPDAPLVMGAHRRGSNGALSQRYVGEMDEVAVYTSALPAERVAAHHAAMSGTDTGGDGDGGLPPPLGGALVRLGAVARASAVLVPTPPPAADVTERFGGRWRRGLAQAEWQPAVAVPPWGLDPDGDDPEGAADHLDVVPDDGDDPLTDADEGPPDD